MGKITTLKLDMQRNFKDFREWV